MGHISGSNPNFAFKGNEAFGPTDVNSKTSGKMKLGVALKRTVPSTISGKNNVIYTVYQTGHELLKDIGKLNEQALKKTGLGVGSNYVPMTPERQIVMIDNAIDLLKQASSAVKECVKDRGLFSKSSFRGTSNVIEGYIEYLEFQRTIPEAGI